MNEAALVLPPGAVDRSFTHVLLTTPSGFEVTFVVERMAVEPGQSLRDAYASYVRDLQMRLRRFSPVMERETTVDGTPALEIGVHWRNAGGDNRYTRQVHLRLEALWLVVGIEGPRDVRQEIDALFEPIVASIQLRSD